MAITEKYRPIPNHQLGIKKFLFFKELKKLIGKKIVPVNPRMSFVILSYPSHLNHAGLNRIPFPLKSQSEAGIPSGKFKIHFLQSNKGIIDKIPNIYSL